MTNGMVLPPRHGLSLCAGGGGLDMGLGLAEPGFATACYVEIEEYPRNTLIAGQRAGYLHPAPIWDDLKRFNARPWRGQIDTLLAGYPCQPFSQAGQRKGEDDPRHLWPDIERIIGELGPGLRWCFFENVAGHLTLGLETVVRSLQGMGFSVAVGLFSAEETGTTHERQRVFIVAYRECQLSERRGEPGDVASTSARAEGEARQRERHGNASHDGRADVAHACGSARYQGGASLGGGCAGQGSTREATGPSRSGAYLHPPGPSDMDAWRNVLAVYPDGAPALSLGDLSTFARYFAALVEAGHLSEAEAERRLHRMADGLAGRSRALRLLGNGVFPLAAAYAWRSLSAAQGLGSVDLAGAAGTARRAAV